MYIWNVSYLIIKSLDFIEQHLGAKHFCVVLFEINTLVI